MGEPTLKVRRFPPPQRSRKAVWLGCVAGLLSRLRLKRTPRMTSDDLRRHDYPISTQRMGIRFTERIRDTFRFHWLKRTH
jgi:hypothetical protein